MKTRTFFSFEGKSDLQDRVSAWKREGLKVAFVPTMGALHAGHLSLVDTAHRHADRVVASIFVNPTQFAPGEDLETYPRTIDADPKSLQSRNCDAVYLPGADEIYPFGLPATQVEVPRLGDPMEGAIRPHFFGGVASVVLRLLNHVQPDIAVFGEKDFQQLQIVRRMVTDLGLNIEIIGSPTGRAADGLALSSRNAYLTPENRERAGILSAALHRAACRVSVGSPVADALAEARLLLEKTGFGPVDYVEMADAESLESLTIYEPGKTCRVFGAAWLGKTRLIDNIAVPHTLP